MSIKGNSKKIFLVCFFLFNPLNSKADWLSLYEEYEKSDNKNLYLYPIDINAGYCFNDSSGFKTIKRDDENITSAQELLFEDDKKHEKHFFNHGIRIDAGVLMTGYNFAKKWFCFPRFGFLYQHLFFNMKMEDNGSIDDFIFYFSPVSSPADTFEIAPRIGLGLSIVNIPREYCTVYPRVEDGVDKDGRTKYKKKPKATRTYLYDGIDFSFIYELTFKLRFLPEWTIYSSVGAIYRPLCFKNYVIDGKRSEQLSSLSKAIDSLKIKDSGLTTFGVTLGFNYNIKPAIESPDWYNKNLRNTDKKVKIKLESVNGFRPVYTVAQEYLENTSNKQGIIITKGDREWVGGIDFKMLLQYNNYQALGLGIGFKSDFARKKEIQNSKLPSTTEYLNIHILGAHEFIYNKLILENLIGLNIKKHDKIGPGKEEKQNDGLLFWQPSINMKINKFLFIGTGAHISIFSTPIEKAKEEVKNYHDILKIDYLNLLLGIDCTLNPSDECDY